MDEIEKLVVTVHKSQRRIKLRAITDQILSMPVEDRLRQIEEEAAFFSETTPLD